MACTGISATSGIFLIFLLGTLLPWRSVAMICAAIPTFTVIAVYFVSIISMLKRQCIVTVSYFQWNGCSMYRFQRHQFGCCPKIATMKP